MKKIYIVSILIVIFVILLLYSLYYSNLYKQHKKERIDFDLEIIINPNKDTKSKEYYKRFVSYLDHLLIIGISADYKERILDIKKRIINENMISEEIADNYIRNEHQFIEYEINGNIELQQTIFRISVISIFLLSIILISLVIWKFG